MSKYVRLTGIINKTPVAIGLLHNGTSLTLSNDESLYEIPLSGINEDFYAGDDTAPLYDGFVQYAFLEKDAINIANFINSDQSFKTNNVKVVKSY